VTGKDIQLGILLTLGISFLTAAAAMLEQENYYMAIAFAALGIALLVMYTILVGTQAEQKVLKKLSEKPSGGG